MRGETTSASSADTTEPRVSDHRVAPPGVVPRHLQQWVLTGLVAVMAGILALAGPPQKPRPPSASSLSPAAVDANQQRIEAYQRRIQEEVDRLSAERARLELAKERSAVETSTGAEHPSAAPNARADRRGMSSAGPRDPAPRDEHALFADNVAFARSMPPPAIASASPQTSASSPTVVPAINPRPSAASSEEPIHTYRLFEGTVIETVLTNRLDGTFAGPVNAMVTTPVYAPDAQHLLIPAGSRLLGDASPVSTFGQSRLAVVFHRLILPNRTVIDLQKFQGLGQAGDHGLQDQVNRHYAQIFGASLAVGAIAGLTQAQSAVGLNATAFDVYRQGAAANVAQSSARILDRFLNILPSVTIREGHRIKVYLSNDLNLPAYRDAPASNGGRP